MGIIERLRNNRLDDPTSSGIIRVGGATYNATYNFTRMLDSVYANPTGRRCVERMASDFQRPAWEVTKPNTTQPLEAHPLLDILNEPNPSMSGTTMQYHMSRDLDLSGATFWLKLRGSLDDETQTNTGKLVGLRRLPPQRVTVIGNQDDELLGFIYQNRLGQRSGILPEDCVYIHYPHPERACDRMAPAITAGLAAETDTAAMRFNFELLANDGGLPGYISVEGLSTSQFLQWKTMWESGQAPGRTRFLGGSGKATYTRVGMTNQEMTYDKLRDASQEDICRALGPPKVLIDPTDSTFANMDIANRTYISSVIAPRWTMAADALTRQLGYELGAPVAVGFNTDSIAELSEALDALVTRGIALLDASVITINQLRADIGLEPVEWGDVPASQTVPAAPFVSAPPLARSFDDLGEIGAGIKAFELNEGDTKAKERKVITFAWFERRREPFTKSATRVMERFFERQANALIKRVESKKGKSFKGADDWAAIWDESRWEAELTDVASTMLAGPIDSFATQALNDLNPDALLNDHANNIENFLIRRSHDFASLVNGTTSDEVRDVVAQVHNDSGGVPDVAAAIRDYFDNNASMRAERVARTEINGACNFASLEGARQSGVVTHKVWLDSDADDDCAAYAELDPIPIDADWDGFDSPPAHPNCLCSVSFVVDESGES